MSSGWNTGTERLMYKNLAEYALHIENSDVSLSDDDSFFSFDSYSSSDSSTSNTLDSSFSDSSSSSGFSIGSIFSSDSEESDGQFIADIFEFGDDLYGSKTHDTIDEYGPDILISDLPDNDVTTLEFRFRKCDLMYLSSLLWPRLQKYLDGTYQKIELPNRNYIHFEMGFLMLLYRLMYPTRLRPEMECRFKCSPTRISLALNTFVKAFYQLSFPYFSDVKIWENKIEEYASIVEEKTGGIATNVWAFIDGTLRKNCRPTYDQKSSYSGHKRHHGLKYQSVYVPDGMIACLYGPVPGSRHDSFMLNESGLLFDLRDMLPEGNFSIYGDPAYPQSGWIHGGFRNPAPGSDEARYNTEMSKVRICVEWGFKDVTQQFSYLNLYKQMMIYKTPVAAYYFVACFIQNLRVCFYGNQTTLYYGVIPMSVMEYLELADGRDE